MDAVGCGGQTSSQVWGGGRGEMQGQMEIHSLRVESRQSGSIRASTGESNNSGNLGGQLDESTKYRQMEKQGERVETDRQQEGQGRNAMLMKLARGAQTNV